MGEGTNLLPNFISRAVERFSSFVCGLPEQENVFSEEELNEYQELTHLTREEIIICYKNFMKHGPVPLSGCKNPYMPRRKLMAMPQFMANPFSDRLIRVFGACEEFFTFENYLDMMSVFSKNAPLRLKAEYAFRLYDIDYDDMLSMGDLENLIKKLIGENELDERDIRELAARVLIEGDLDEDGELAFPEFLHLMRRTKEFSSSFSMAV